MEKILLNNKKEFEAFESENTGCLPFYGNVKSYMGEPENYPCIVVWQINYDGNGPDCLEGEFVYLSDFI